MSFIFQAIIVPALVAISLGYLLFVTWASERCRPEVESERKRFSKADPGEDREEADAPHSMIQVRK